ncbi:Calcium channel YVC1 [Sphaceloma murrayae]|uniref:Calcium channel YVC1 n=1 Tax=Sphaceloma murrayae TaxID=2082308 RepID=A0A2K1QUD3_9PEZI|nr:Calcium channel YVC1 [Sphaceloma murrayae]
MFSGPSIPHIHGAEDFDEVAKKLAVCIVKAIRQPATFEELRKVKGKALEPLCRHLSTKVHHPAVVSALMALSGHFVALEDEDEEGVNLARAMACEYVALRYVSHMSDRELIDALLRDVPKPAHTERGDLEEQQDELGERSPLLNYDRSQDRSETDDYFGLDGNGTVPESTGTTQAYLYDGVQELNALEIAAVCGAKKFLGDKIIQRIITAIWHGDIIFWSSLSTDAIKHAHIYKERSADPYSRLRVPKYLKWFEVAFFLGFLTLYYVVLIEKSFYHITAAEILLFIWLASFAYNELGEFWDAGTAFYLADFWTLWDVGIVVTGTAFLVCRVVGLTQGSKEVIDTSFDLLAMEALFLVPRDMTKDFIKFLSLVVILYLGFLTTFSLLARGNFTFRQMSWILIKVFFGSSYLGFDVAEQISPVLGPPLMLIFVCLTNILLITSLISLLSNSLTKVIEHASDEYKFVYSVFVLEASTSNRLTYFLPPLNLIPLVLRPIRLFLTAEQQRTVRIALLKATHFPHVFTIQLYEGMRKRFLGRQRSTIRLAPSAITPERPRGHKRYSRSSRLSTPQPLAAPNLKPNVLFGDEQDWNQDDAVPDAVEAIKSLEATVARLSRQVEQLSGRAITG